MRYGFRLEPTSWSEAVRQVVLAAVLLGAVELTDAQQLAIIAAVSAVLAAINRSVVTPSGNVPPQPPGGA